MQFATAFKCSIKYDFHQIEWNLCEIFVGQVVKRAKIGENFIACNWE